MPASPCPLMAGKFFVLGTLQLSYSTDFGTSWMVIDEYSVMLRWLRQSSTIHRLVSGRKQVSHVCFRGGWRAILYLYLDQLGCIMEFSSITGHQLDLCCIIGGRQNLDGCRIRLRYSDWAGR